MRLYVAISAETTYCKETEMTATTPAQSWSQIGGDVGVAPQFGAAQKRYDTDGVLIGGLYVARRTASSGRFSRSSSSVTSIRENAVLPEAFDVMSPSRYVRPLKPHVIEMFTP